MLYAPSNLLWAPKNIGFTHQGLVHKSIMIWRWRQQYDSLMQHSLVQQTSPGVGQSAHKGCFLLSGSCFGFMLLVGCDVVATCMRST